MKITENIFGLPAPGYKHPRERPSAARKEQDEIFISALAHKHGATAAVIDGYTNTRRRDALHLIARRDDGFIARNLRTGIVGFYSHADVYEEQLRFTQS